jgi:hypothetical protein
MRNDGRRAGILSAQDHCALRCSLDSERIDSGHSPEIARHVTSGMIGLHAPRHLKNAAVKWAAGFLTETYGYDAESRLVGASVFNLSRFSLTIDSGHDERMLRGAKLSYDRRGNVTSTSNPHQRQDAITSFYTGLGQVYQTSTTYRQASWSSGSLVWSGIARWELTHTDPFGDKLDDTVQTTNSDWYNWYYQRGATTAAHPGSDTTKYQSATGHVRSTWSDVNFALPDTADHQLYEYDEKGNVRFLAIDGNVTKGPVDTIPPDPAITGQLLRCG